MPRDIRWMLAGGVFIFDCFTPANIVIPLFYLFIPYVGAGDLRKGLMPLAVVCAGLTLVEPLFGVSPTVGASLAVLALNRLLMAAVIYGAAYALRSRFISESLRDKAVEELKEAVKAREIFLATLAHELRNPLAPLSNGVAILQRSGDSPHGQLLEMMERQVRHLVRLVDDLLEVSRIRGGKMHLSGEQADVRDVVRNAIEICKPSIDHAGQRITESIEQDVPEIVMDRTRITQALANLIDNASKFTPQGGLIQVTAKRNENRVLVSVRDNGRGIASDALPSIFNLFMREQDAMSIRGLGLGLALVKEIAELHGGSVEAHSEGQSKGSEFVLALPMPQLEPESLP